MSLALFFPLPATGLTICVYVVCNFFLFSY